MSERKRYVVNYYGPDDRFLHQATPRLKPKIGGRVLVLGENLSIWYVEELAEGVFNARLERL